MSPEQEREFAREDRERLASASNVYFIECAPGPIKIGFSVDPVGQRIDQLQPGNPWPLRLLFMQPGHLELEQALHERFKDYRMHGEWFRDHPFLLRFVLSEKAKAAKAAWPHRAKVIDDIVANAREALQIRPAIYALDFKIA